ncbi:hypothetical protein LTS18_005015 [Coniosporium uncinatum]|uniref:Uncharacterized protein n=1 Tax=Coniosporium uncinatum TaxID=93489 RepID=A0ACC3DRL1_9PEZI|nr:hypothetical protein LTS18_005015 [Coniosporium uncinatum]
MSFDGFFRIVVADDVDLTALPGRIANQGVYYQRVSDEQFPDPSALRLKPPSGVVQDDHNYLADGNTLLRPGVMVSSSSLPNGQWKSTTSGIPVMDLSGSPFITVATHGFNPDDEVWHPNPKGTMIGKIVHSISGTDISLVRLTKGLRYVNQTFGTLDEPEGTVLNGLSPGYQPHLQKFDIISMNNPFSGRADGRVLAVGIKIEGKDVMHHDWLYMDVGTEPVDGSCGTAILSDEGTVVGFFRYKLKDPQHCYAVSALELREGKYEICGQEMEF